MTETVDMFDFDSMIENYSEPAKAGAKPESALILSSFGQGKTHMAGTAIDVPGFKKGLYIDTEGSSVNVITDPRWRIVRVDQYPSPERAAKLAEARGVPIEELDLIEERFLFLKQILSDKKGGMFAPNTKFSYDVVAIDAVDVAQQLAKHYYMEGSGIVYTDKGEENTFKAWDNVASWLRGVAQRIKSHKAFGIFVVHEADKKLKSGAIQPTVALQGAMKEELPGLVDMVMRMERTLEEDEEGNPTKVTYATFLSDDKVTKDRFDFPPVVKNPNFPALFKYIDKKAKETK